MKKYWQVIICGTVFLSSLSIAELTMDMERFLIFAVQYNGNQKGFTKDDVENAFKIDMINRKASKGKVSYESRRMLENQEDVPVFKLTFLSNQAIILDFNFTESPKEFIRYAERLRGYESLLLPRTQVNGMPIYYFAGEDINNFIPTKKFWIRIYECSDKPQDKCVRNAEILFAKKDLVL